MRIESALITLACFLAILNFSVADEVASNWHQWRGPLGNGVSRTANPPVEWSEKKNIRWKVPIDGRGTSTPIIWGSKVFLLSAVDTGVKDKSIPDPKDQPKSNFFDIKRPNTEHAFVTLCLDRYTGKEIWRKTAFTKVPHEGAHNDNDFASASPVTDGEHLYCWFGSAGLVCYDLDGNQKWIRRLGEVRVESSLGEGCSPVLHDDKLIIVRDNAGQSSIEVLESATGKTVWKKDRDEKTAWATPLVIESNGTTQIVTAASKLIRSYDLKSGDMIWKCGGLTGNVIPCPVVLDDHVICMSGYQGYAALSVPYTEKGDLTGSDKIRWHKKRGTPYIPSPLLYDGLLFFNQSNQPILTCLNAESGETFFGPKRISLSNIYASPVGAADRVYFIGRTGKAVVLKKGTELKVLATNQLDERFDASPAVAGKQIFLRGVRYLYCIENR